MRINIRKLANPQRVLHGLAFQVAGVIVLACTNKYVPNPYARWGLAALAAAAGVWYPITEMLLKASHLDEQISNI